MRHYQHLFIVHPFEHQSQRDEAQPVRLQRGRVYLAATFLSLAVFFAALVLRAVYLLAGGA